MSTGTGETENEKYLFGLESPSIRNSRTDILPCGIYATNKRIFLVRSPAGVRILVVGVWVGAFVLFVSALAALIYLPMIESLDAAIAVGFPLLYAGLIFLVISSVVQWHRSSSPVPIQELERREVYEIDRAEISSIEMKGSDFWTSQIKVHLKSGKSRSILFSVRGSFERAKSMFSQGPKS